MKFCINTRVSSIWPIDKTLSGITTPGLSGPGSDGNKGVLHIPQTLRITKTSRSDCLMSHAGHSLGVLPLCRDVVGVFYRLSRLGHKTLVEGILALCKDVVYIFYSPSRLGHRTLIGRVLTVCRDAVGVFYSPSRLGNTEIGQNTKKRPAVTQTPVKSPQLLAEEFIVIQRELKQSSATPATFVPLGQKVIKYRYRLILLYL